MSMKSRAVLLMDVLDGVLIDINRAYPKDELEWQRDSIRLHSIVERGELWFLTMTLPTWSKALTRALDQGSILPLGGPHSRPKRGLVYPKLFSGLWAKIFDNSGLLREDADIAAIRFLQTLLCLGKKIRMNCDDRVVVETVQSFVEVEANIRDYSLNWGDAILAHDGGISIHGNVDAPVTIEEGRLFPPVPGDSRPLLSYLGAIQSVADRVFSSFGSPFYGELKPHHGPGAISEGLSISSSKYQFPNWPEKLERCFPHAEFGYPNLSYWVQPVVGQELRFKDQKIPSRLVAVPKTQKGPRLIAAEPSSNMWMQQALRHFVEEATATSLISASVDFRSQHVSGDMALKSSLTRTHATIDLSDASDRLSVWLIERLFRRNRDLLDAFNAVRTDEVEIKRSKLLPVPKNCPQRIKLRKFSTQGSALTFPIQTVVFTVVAIGTVIRSRNLTMTSANIRNVSKEVRVFGDDIIVPNDVMGKVVEMLTHLGLKVNVSKSFSEGNFRESCGVDAYKGVDVTPTYVLEPYDKSRPTSIASVVESSNNLFTKGFYAAADALRRTLPTQMRNALAVVGIDSGAFGIIDFVSTGTYRSRYNQKLQRREISVLCLTARAPKIKFEGEYALHQYFTERPDPTSKWENGEARKPRAKVSMRWVPEEILA